MKLLLRVLLLFLLIGAGRGVAGAGVATTDILMQEYKSQLIDNSEFSKYQTTFANWDVLYGTVMLMDGATNLSLLTRNILVAKNWLKFTNEVEHLSGDAIKTELKIVVNEIESGEAVAGNAAAISTRIDNLLANSQAQPFINDLINFSVGNSGRIARYGDVATLKNTLKSFIENPIVNNVKSYDLLINDIENFMVNYRSVPGALNYFDELLQTPLKFKGGAFGLEILSNPPPIFAGKTLTRLEAGIDDVDNFRFDMLFEDGSGVKIFVETKNYASGTSFTTSFYNQFKAYISNPQLENMEQLKYFFRSNDGVTKATQVQKFKNMLLNGDKYEEIFNANEKLMNSLGFSKSSHFKAILESNNTTHPFFNFIEVY